MGSIKHITYCIDKIISLFKYLSKFTIVFDGVFVLATLEPVIFDDWSDLRLELALDM